MGVGEWWFGAESREVVLTASDALVLLLGLGLGFEGGVRLEGKPEYVRPMVWPGKGLEAWGAVQEAIGHAGVLAGLFSPVR